MKMIHSCNFVTELPVFKLFKLDTKSEEVSYLLCSSSGFTDCCLRSGDCLFWPSKEIRFFTGGWLKVWARRRNCRPASGSSSEKAGGDPGGDWPGDSSSCWRGTLINHCNINEQSIKQIINLNVVEAKSLSEAKLNTRLKVQVFTHLANERQQDSAWTFHSTLLDSVASCLVLQLPQLLYSNGQCPVTHSITHYWWGRGSVTQLHMKTLQSPPIMLFQTSLSKTRGNRRHLDIF